MNYTLSNINLILYATFFIIYLIGFIISKIRGKNKNKFSLKELIIMNFYLAGLAILLNIVHPILSTIWLSFILIPALLSIISIYDKKLSNTLSDAIEYFIDNFFEGLSITIIGIFVVLLFVKYGYDILRIFLYIIDSLFN